jgi:hypothetical protein
MSQSRRPKANLSPPMSEQRARPKAKGLGTARTGIAVAVPLIVPSIGAWHYYISMLQMLTLDPITLFYINLRHERLAPHVNKRRRIEVWAQSALEPESPPSLASASTMMPSMTLAPLSAIQPDIDGAVAIHDEDGEEMMGPERQFALESPPKGKRRVTSDVSTLHDSLVPSYTNKSFE